MNPVRDRRDSRWDNHREQRRAELVVAAIGAVRTHGAGVGMDDVAAAAGTSKTVVYRHFRDRTGLYVAVCEAVATTLVTRIRTAVDRARDATGSPHAMVAAGIDAYLWLLENDREVYRFVVHRPLLDTGTTDPVTDLTTVIGDHAAGVIGEALQGCDPRAARSWGHGLVGLVRGAADDWLARPDGTTRAELTARLTHLAWTGLAGLRTPEVTP